MVLIPKLCSQVASSDPAFPCSHVPIGFPKCPWAASNLVFPCSRRVSQAQYFSCSRWFPCSQASSQAKYPPRLVSFKTQRSSKNLVQGTVYTFRQGIGENGKNHARESNPRPLRNTTQDLPDHLSAGEIETRGPNATVHNPIDGLWNPVNPARRGGHPQRAAGDQHAG